MKLKFGHRVIGTRDFDAERYKGRYISSCGNLHSILVDGKADPTWYSHAELDPDATPINGDLVEYRNIDDPGWHRHGIYIGEKTTGKHVIQEYEGGTGPYDCVRHQQKDSHHGKTAIIDGKEYELRLK